MTALAPSAPPAAATSLQRSFLHVDLDCFFVSVERLLDPRLAQRPVIVGGDPERRGVVTSASHEVRQHGIHAGMPTAVAQRLCPDAVFLPGRLRIYGRISSAVHGILLEHAPWVEKASIDEAYLDVTDQVAEGRSAIDLAARLQDDLEDRLGLPCSVGIGSNVTVAKIACGQAKPEGLLEIWPGYEQAFLAPLEVDELPGVGGVMAEQLRLFGLNTVGDVARVEPRLLEDCFGMSGRQLASTARGEGRDRLHLDRDPKSLAHERTFPQDVNDPERLMKVLGVLSKSLASRARSRRVKAGAISLKLRTDDFRTRTKTQSLSSPTDSASEIEGVATFLLRSLRERNARPVRLLGIGLHRLNAGPSQQPLFPAVDPEKEQALPAQASLQADSAEGRGLRPRAVMPQSLESGAIRATGQWSFGAEKESPAVRRLRALSRLKRDGERQ
ncbi:MAG: DNA polymerase IV [Acidobacteriota bacterium]